MKSERSKAHTIPAFHLLAAACLGLGAIPLFAPVSRAAGPQPHWVVPPPGESTGPEIQQRVIVEAEVTVRTGDEANVLQRLGYSCGIRVCKLELAAAQEVALIGLGLPVQVVARAIKLSAAPHVAAWEAYEHGRNWSHIAIPDGTAAMPCLCSAPARTTSGRSSPVMLAPAAPGPCGGSRHSPATESTCRCCCGKTEKPGIHRSPIKMLDTYGSTPSRGTRRDAFGGTQSVPRNGLSGPPSRRFGTCGRVLPWP